MNGEGVKRLREIVRVFTRYGFGYLFHRSSKVNETSPEALRRAFEELGATFIKIGQILSTRPDLLPKEYLKELEKLQDCNSFTDFESLKNIFKDEFNKDIGVFFKNFDETPFAAASVAQVHKATLIDGKNVVVKVQHKNIDKKMKLDIRILRKLSKLIKNRIDFSLIDIVEVLDEIEKTTVKELNFLEEANNMIKFKELNQQVKCVTSPEVYMSLTSKKILTMEEMNGFKITDLEALEAEDFDRYDVGKKLALSFSKQVFDDGFFHGDPHPGNLLIVGQKIAFIDFGIMGELSNKTKKALNRAVVSMGLRDVDGVISFIMSVGTLNDDANYNNLYSDLNIFLNKYVDATVSNIKMSKLLEEIFTISNKNNIKLPSEFVSLVRAIVILEGVITNITPDLEIMDVIISFLKNKNKKSILSELEIDELKIKTYKFILDTMKVPTKFSELVDSISKGRAKFYVEVSDIKLILHNLHKMINRISFTGVVGCMIIASSLILNANIGPKFKGITILGLGGYIASAVLGFWLLISIIKSGFF